MDKVGTRDLSFRSIIKPYLERWRLFFVSIILFLLVAFYYIKSSVPVYKTISTVLIKDAQKMSSASGDFGVLQSLGAVPGMGTSSIENEIDIFKSKTIIEDVLKRLDFQTPIYEKGLLFDTELYGETSPVLIKVVKNYSDAKWESKTPISLVLSGNSLQLNSEKLNKPVVSGYNQLIHLPFADIIISKNKDFKRQNKNTKNSGEIYITYNSFDNTVNAFQDSVITKLSNKEGTIIELSIDYPQKQKAQIFLNNLVQQYNLYAIDDKNMQSAKSKEFIDERINLIANELGDVESKKQRFKSDNNIVDLGSEARINLQTKVGTKTRLLDIDTQLELNTDLQRYLNKKDIGDVLPVNVGLANDAATKGILDYNELVMQRNNLLNNATAENPTVKELEKKIYSLKSSVSQSISKNRTSLEFARDRVVREMGSSENNISKIPFQEKLFRDIERQQQIKENLYLILLQKREEAAITMAITSEKARIVDKAHTFKKPVSPQKALILGIAFALGIILPFLYIFARLLMNNKIEKGSDFKQKSQVPLLAEIPKLAKGEREYIAINDISQMAEAFRILVTNLKYMLPIKDSAKIILVTSSVKGEGKTFVSVNLSLALSSSLKKVLVIGSDIRNPQLQRFNTDKKNAVGLSEYLYGEIDDPSTIIHPSGFHTNCDFIYSGSIPPNPTELLENSRYEKLLAEVSALYDYVIIDSAPLMLVTDTLLISRFADATLYVLRSEFSELEFVDFAQNTISSGKINNVAFVLNDVSLTNLGYGNKYGYGYHADKKSWFKRIFSGKN